MESSFIFHLEDPQKFSNQQALVFLSLLFVCLFFNKLGTDTIGTIFLCVHVFLLSAFIFILWLQGQHFLGSIGPVLNSERMGPFQLESMVLSENGGRPNILWGMARGAGVLRHSEFG